MDQDIEALLADIDRAIAILTTARDRLKEQEPTPDPKVCREVAVKLERHECLQCGMRYTKSGGLGLCSGCYAATYYQLYTTHEANYRDLVMAGKIKPKAVRNTIRRKRKSAKRQWTALDDHIQEQRAKQLDAPTPADAADEAVSRAKRKSRKR